MSELRNAGDLIAYASLALACFALALVARGAGPLVGDVAFSQMLQALFRSTSLLSSALVWVGERAWVFVVATVLAMLAWRQWARACLVIIAAVAGYGIGDLILKEFIARPRPTAALVLVYDRELDFGFPSATTLMVASALGALWFSIDERSHLQFWSGAAVAAVVLVVGLGRVYAGSHWVSDVVGSWLLAGLLVPPLLIAFRRFGALRSRGRGPLRFSR